MLVKELISYFKSNIEKFNPQLLNIHIYDGPRPPLFEARIPLTDEVDIKIPENLLNQEVRIFDMTHYCVSGSLYFSIKVKAPNHD